MEKSRDLELPADLSIRILAPWIAKAIEHRDLPQGDAGVKYVVKLAGDQRSLNPENSLRSAGVVHGDVLQLTIKPLPPQLSVSESGRSFAGPGLVSPSGRVFALRASSSLVGRIDLASGVAESVLAVDLTGLDSGDSPSVSRRHAQILRRAGGFHLLDLQSTNGTRLNGRQLKPGDRVELNDGDILLIGDVQLVFVWDGQDRRTPEG